MDGVAGEDDGGGCVWLDAKKIGEIAGDDFGATGPDGDVFLGECRGGIGDVDAVVAGDIGFCKRMGGKPGVAAAEVDDAKRLWLLLRQGARVATISAWCM